MRESDECKCVYSVSHMASYFSQLSPSPNGRQREREREEREETFFTVLTWPGCVFTNGLTRVLTNAAWPFPEEGKGEKAGKKNDNDDVSLRYVFSVEACVFSTGHVMATQGFHLVHTMHKDRAGGLCDIRLASMCRT